jgi:serine/threonine-protein kinase
MKKLGKFEIVEKVGQGAMGIVYKARDPLIGRLVALKTITTGLAEDSSQLERFYHEAHSAGALQHPNIVTIYELGEEDHTPYIAMEYLSGQSLDKLIENRQELPLSQKIGYISYVCRALAYAHKQGVVHRDIKPANVMVTTEGTVKVVDFGIARIAETSKSQTGLVIGTLGYMSPQQIEGGRADARSDVWAAGILFYELLAYRRPFDAENYGTLMLNIMTLDLPPLSEVAPGTPDDVAEVLNLMLRKDVEERYQSMEEVLIDLEPVWRRLQREEVIELLSAARQKLETGNVGTAYEMVRRVLQIDTANASAKTLLEEINEETRKNRTALSPPAEKDISDGETLLGTEINPIRPPVTTVPPPPISRTRKQPAVQSSPPTDTASRLRAATEARKTVASPIEVTRPAPAAAPIAAATPIWKKPALGAVLILAVVIAAGGGAYFLKMRQPAISTPETPTSTTAAVSNAPAQPGQSEVALAVSQPPTASSTESRTQPPDLPKRSPDTNPSARATPPPVVQTPAGQKGSGQSSSQTSPPAASAQDRTVVAMNNPAPPPPSQPPAAAAQPAAPAVQPTPVATAPAPVVTPAASKTPEPAAPAKAAEAPVVSTAPADNLDRQQISLSLQQLSAAFSHRSVAELGELWPKLSKDDRNSYKKAFDSAKAITRDFHLQSLNISADGALATAIGSYEGTYQIGGSSPTPQSGNFYVRFAKKNGRWYVDEARF